MLISILFYPLPLKGKSKNQHFTKSPLGDLGVKELFRVESLFDIHYSMFIIRYSQNSAFTITLKFLPGMGRHRMVW
jgi:hypothetical protein